MVCFSCPFMLGRGPKSRWHPLWDEKNAQERMRSKLTGMSYDSKEWEPPLQDIEAEKASMLEA